MGMSEQDRRIVLATGFHSSATARLGRFLEARGYQVLWPNQDLDVFCYEAHGEALYHDHCENIEVLRLNEEMLHKSGMNWWQATGPITAQLSVRPLLEMFRGDKAVLLLDPRFCLTWPAYSGFVSDVIYVGAEPQASARELEELWGLDQEHWLRLYDVYVKAFESSGINPLVLSTADCLDQQRLQARLASLPASC